MNIAIVPILLLIASGSLIYAGFSVLYNKGKQGMGLVVLALCALLIAFGMA